MTSYDFCLSVLMTRGVRLLVVNSMKRPILVFIVLLFMFPGPTRTRVNVFMCLNAVIDIKSAAGWFTK